MSLQPSDKAWITLGVGVLAYEVAVGEDQLLSSAAERYMLRHPWLVRGIAFTLAAHCCSMLPAPLDPLAWLFKAKRRLLP